MEELNLKGKNNQMYVLHQLSAIHNEAGAILRSQLACSRTDALLEAASAVCDACGGRRSWVNRVPQRHPRTAAWVHMYLNAIGIPANLCTAGKVHELIKVPVQ